MIVHRDVFIEFRFYSIAPTSGIELNGLFGPKSRPFPFFFLVGFFFIPIPACLPHDPIKGGGLYKPILGAPLPPCGGGMGSPILGVPFPVKAFNIIGIPILASKVPRKPPDCIFVGFITTPEPD